MKREKAIIAERRNKIKEMACQNPILQVNQLAETFGVSRMTIRRDFMYLESNKNINRIYGGAVAVSDSEDELQLYRTLIAQCAAGFVEDNDTIFLNTGRNALLILKYIARKNITVITNNGRAINAERNEETNIILTGGELRNPKDTMVGDFTIRSLQPIYAKKTFISCFGISAENGISTEIANEVNINSMMVEHTAKDVFVLADHTKIGVNSSFTSCPIDKIKYLITDEKASEIELSKIRKRGVQIIQVSIDKL